MNKNRIKSKEFKRKRIKHAYVVKGANQIKLAYQSDDIHELKPDKIRNFKQKTDKTCIFKN